MEHKKKDTEAKCPYFKYHTEQTIICEGIVPDTKQRMIFEKKAAKWTHYKAFCCKGYWRCEQCQALDEIKYREE